MGFAGSFAAELWSSARRGARMAGLGLGVVAAMVSGEAGAAGDAPPPPPKLIVSVDGFRLSLDATDAPLESVLAAVAAEAGFALDVIGGLRRTVSDRFVGVALDRAIARLLGNASFVLTLRPPRTEGGVQELRKLLVISREAVGDRRGGAPARMAAAAERRDPRTPAERRLERRRAKYREVRRLGRDRSPEASGKLSDVLLNDRDPAVRLQAAKALARARHGSETEALIAAVDDPVDAVGRRAIASLGKIGGGERAADRLIEILRSSMDWQDQVLAARALARVATPGTRAALAAATRDRNAQVRKAAWASLSRIERAGRDPG